MTKLLHRIQFKSITRDSKESAGFSIKVKRGTTYTELFKQLNDHCKAGVLASFPNPMAEIYVTSTIELITKNGLDPDTELVFPDNTRWKYQFINFKIIPIVEKKFHKYLK